jgi:hypothetical protein
MMCDVLNQVREHVDDATRHARDMRLPRPQGSLEQLREIVG